MTDQDHVLAEHPAQIAFLEEIVQQHFRRFKIGNDPVLQRTDADHAARRAAQHLLGFLAGGDTFLCLCIYGENGRFVDDDPFIVHTDEQVRCS